MKSRDYEEFIESLNANGVKYLLIGAHAVAFHARPRATKDLDILIEASQANARRVLAAMRDFFGGVDLGFEVEDLINPKTIVQLGVAPVRIDLLSSMVSIQDFEEAWQRRVDAKYGDVDTHYISREDLIAEKEKTGRAQDKADAKTLRRAKDRQHR